METQRWRDVDLLLRREGALTGPGFEPSEENLPFIRDDCKVLVVGAGGLGCELLKDLALLGFGNLQVIDMDTIDVSNLNRQFLFRMKDVGKPKAVVAAEKIMERIAGVKVVSHFARIEDKPLEFYKDFHIIVLGLDSVEARSWINATVCSFLEYGDDGQVDLATLKPLVDGGTEGFKGHTRVILPGITPCFACTMWLFPPQTKFPLCTLAETPRTPVHCIEYAHLIQWPKERAEEDFDVDNAEHQQWCHRNALARAEQFGIEGVTMSLVQGVVKNIIPAIASTNAIVAAACATEVLKMATCCSAGMNNYMMYMGGEGIYTHTVAYEKDPQCTVCSSGISMIISESKTLEELLAMVSEHPSVQGNISAPSVSYGSKNLYMQGPLEEATRANLKRTMKDLVQSDRATFSINDKKLPQTLRLNVRIQ
jgi:ubiquitin-activating enzyme E1 C